MLMPEALFASSGECDNDLCITLLVDVGSIGGGGGAFGTASMGEAVARHRRVCTMAAGSRPNALVVRIMVGNCSKKINQRQGGGCVDKRFNKVLESCAPPCRRLSQRSVHPFQPLSVRASYVVPFEVSLRWYTKKMLHKPHRGVGVHGFEEA